MVSTGRQESLLAEFEQARAAIREFIASRSERERTANGTPDQWSASELLTAIGFWMDYMVERMEYFQRGETPPAEVDFGGVQAQALAEQAAWTWEQRAASFERAMAALMDEVRRFDDTQLEALNVYGEEPGGPLWGEVQANGFIWPLQELEKYYGRVGEPQRAARVRALLVPVTGEPERIVCDLTAPETLGTSRTEDTPLVIDVRGRADYARGHLPGALHIPLSELPRKLKRLPADRPIVTYCNMHHPGQSRGERAAALLAEHGLHASALAGGFTAWEAAGCPVETSDASKG
jgi:rhodanese-related sulfurtransferase